MTNIKLMTREKLFHNSKQNFFIQNLTLNLTARDTNTYLIFM